MVPYILNFRWDSVAGIGIRYGLTVRVSDVVGARFSGPIQTGPEAHPASCTMDTHSF
jgi:hypothetical protein